MLFCSKIIFDDLPQLKLGNDWNYTQMRYIDQVFGIFWRIIGYWIIPPVIREMLENYGGDFRFVLVSSLFVEEAHFDKNMVLMSWD